jgi:hypothetical protein
MPFGRQRTGAPICGRRSHLSAGPDPHFAGRGPRKAGSLRFVRSPGVGKRLAVVSSALAAALVVGLVAERSAEGAGAVSPPVSTAPAAGLAGAPTSTRVGYSPYEQSTIRDALKKTGLAAEVAPEGKIVESIEVVRLEVIEDRDPLPQFLNAFHATSKDFVIRRESLLRPGERYLQVVADETERNLRTIFQVSLVLVVPVKGSDDDHVRVLMITKDVWSLRLSWDLAATSGGVEKFTLVPQEVNVAGLHHTARTQFVYQPESLTFGAGYKVPRFGYSWVGATTDGGIIVNRRSGELEGGVAKLSAGQPLYSTRTPWSWGASLGGSTGFVRRYSNAQVYPDPRTGVPFEYRSSSASGSLSLVRSFGWKYKLDVSFGVSFSHARYEVPERAGFDPAKVSEFGRRNLPIGETRYGPFLQLRSYTTNFVTLTNFQTLGLQEDVRLGHDVYVAPVTVLPGSTRALTGWSAGAQYTWALRDGLVRVFSEAFGEVQLQGGDGEQRVTDASLSGGLHVVTPRLPIGRLLFSATASNRYRNYLNSQVFLGGDGRLRGYPTNFFGGKDYVVANFEYRSRPLEILSLQVGGVVFYDVGDAMYGFDNLRVKQSLGGGLRVLLPQFNRAVFRADIGFPLERGPFGARTAPIDPFNFYVAFEQAFGFGGI